MDLKVRLDKQDSLNTCTKTKLEQKMHMVRGESLGSSLHDRRSSTVAPGSRPIYINMSYMYVSGPTCSAGLQATGLVYVYVNRSYRQMVAAGAVLLMNVNVHVDALFINL